MSENAALPLDQDVSRELPSQITIPPIKGEMVHLRPASVDDLPRMDELDATMAPPRSPARTLRRNAPSYTRG